MPAFSQAVIAPREEELATKETQVAGKRLKLHLVFSTLIYAHFTTKWTFWQEGKKKREKALD